MEFGLQSHDDAMNDNDGYDYDRLQGAADFSAPLVYRTNNRATLDWNRCWYKCPVCAKILRTQKTWKVHAMAHEGGSALEPAGHLVRSYPDVRARFRGGGGHARATARCQPAGGRFRRTLQCRQVVAD